MASLTVRQLDERLKKLLRLRAAKSGRSVEDEVRTILRAAAEETGTAMPENFTPPSPHSPRRSAPSPAPGSKRVLLIIGGGIAAYKSLDLIRRLKERGFAVRCILTKAAEHFVTPLSAGAIVGERAFTDLFDAGSELDIGHIRLARETDLVVVAPATADLMAKMAGGHRQRSRHRRAIGGWHENSAGAGDEPAYVDEQSDAAQSGATRRRRRHAHWPERRRDGGSR